MAPLFAPPQTAAIKNDGFVHPSPQAKEGGQRLPVISRQPGEGGAGLEPESSPKGHLCRRDPEPNWKRWGCRVPEVQPTEMGQAGPAEGSDEEVSWLSSSGHRAKASGPGAGLGPISQAGSFSFCARWRGVQSVLSGKPEPHSSLNVLQTPISPSLPTSNTRSRGLSHLSVLR